jgi:hypothetical protein
VEGVLNAQLVGNTYTLDELQGSPNVRRVTNPNYNLAYNVIPFGYAKGRDRYVADFEYEGTNFKVVFAQSGRLASTGPIPAVVQGVRRAMAGTHNDARIAQEFFDRETAQFRSASLTATATSVQLALDAALLGRAITLRPVETPLSRRISIIDHGVAPRRVNVFPRNPLDVNSNWGLRASHLQKHFYGNSGHALRQIDPGGTSDKWAQQLSRLFSMPETSRTSNGMIDIVSRFPRSDGLGSYKMGVRLFQRPDGTFDLVTVLTKQ